MGNVIVSFLGDMATRYIIPPLNMCGSVVRWFDEWFIELLAESSILSISQI